jgi:flagellar biosynthesis component FlhA
MLLATFFGGGRLLCVFFGKACIKSKKKKKRQKKRKKKQKKRKRQKKEKGKKSKNEKKVRVETPRIKNLRLVVKEKKNGLR